MKSVMEAARSIGSISDAAEQFAASHGRESQLRGIKEMSEEQTNSGEALYIPERNPHQEGVTARPISTKVVDDFDEVLHLSNGQMIELLTNKYTNEYMNDLSERFRQYWTDEHTVLPYGIDGSNFETTLMNLAINSHQLVENARVLENGSPVSIPDNELKERLKIQKYGWDLIAATQGVEDFLNNWTGDNDARTMHVQGEIMPFSPSVPIPHLKSGVVSKLYNAFERLGRLSDTGNLYGVMPREEDTIDRELRDAKSGSLNSSRLGVGTASKVIKKLLKKDKTLKSLGKSKRKSKAKEAVAEIIEPLIGDPVLADVVVKEIVAAPNRMSVSGMFPFLSEVYMGTKPSLPIPNPEKPKLLPTQMLEQLAAEYTAPSVSTYGGPRAFPPPASPSFSDEGGPEKINSAKYYQEAAAKNLNASQFLKQAVQEQIIPNDLISFAPSARSNQIEFNGFESSLNRTTDERNGLLSGQLAPAIKELSRAVIPDTTSAARVNLSSNANFLGRASEAASRRSMAEPPVSYIPQRRDSSNSFMSYGAGGGGSELFGVNEDRRRANRQERAPREDEPERQLAMFNRGYRFGAAAGGAGGGGGGGGDDPDDWRGAGGNPLRDLGPGRGRGRGRPPAREQTRWERVKGVFRKVERSVSAHLMSSLKVLGATALTVGGAYYMFSGAGGRRKSLPDPNAVDYSAFKDYVDGTELNPYQQKQFLRSDQYWDEFSNSFHTANNHNYNSRPLIESMFSSANPGILSGIGKSIYDYGGQTMVVGAIGIAAMLAGKAMYDAKSVSKYQLEKSRLEQPSNYEKQIETQIKSLTGKTEAKKVGDQWKTEQAPRNIDIRKGKLEMTKQEHDEKRNFAVGMQSPDGFMMNKRIELIKAQENLAKVNKDIAVNEKQLLIIKNDNGSGKERRAADQFAIVQKLKNDRFEYQKTLDLQKDHYHEQDVELKKQGVVAKQAFQLQLEKMKDSRHNEEKDYNRGYKEDRLKLISKKEEMAHAYRQQDERKEEKNFNYKQLHNEHLFDAKNNNLRQQTQLQQEGSLIYQAQLAKQAQSAYDLQTKSAFEAMLTPDFQRIITRNITEPLSSSKMRSSDYINQWLGGADGTIIDRMLGANQDLKTVINRVESPQTMQTLFGVQATRSQLLKTQENLQNRNQQLQDLARDQKVFQSQLGDGFGMISDLIPGEIKFKEGQPTQLVESRFNLARDKQNQVAQLVLTKMSKTVGLALYQAQKGQIIDESVLQTIASTVKIAEDLITRKYVQEPESHSQLEQIGYQGRQFLQIFKDQNTHYNDLYQEQLNLVEERLAGAEEGLQSKEDKIKRKDKISDAIEQQLAKLGLTQQLQGGNAQGQGGAYGSGNFQRQKYTRSRLDEMFDGADPRQREQIDEARTKQAILEQVGQGKSITGNFGNATSVGQNALKVAQRDKKITAEDVMLLKQITIDKRTGLAMKMSEDGNLIDLTPEEKERVAHAIIEICLYLYAKNVKAVSQMQIDQYREAIQQNIKEQTEDNSGVVEDIGLLNLVKVANTVANKLVQGGLNQYQLKKYIKTLAGQNLAAIDEKDTQSNRRRGGRNDEDAEMVDEQK